MAINSSSLGIVECSNRCWSSREDHQRTQDCNFLSLVQWTDRGASLRSPQNATCLSPSDPLMATTGYLNQNFDWGAQPPGPPSTDRDPPLGGGGRHLNPPRYRKKRAGGGAPAAAAEKNYLNIPFLGGYILTRCAHYSIHPCEAGRSLAFTWPRC